MAILGINELLTLLGYFLSVETSMSVSIFNAGISVHLDLSYYKITLPNYSNFLTVDFVYDFIYEPENAKTE
jgi:hypothetical protein